MSNPVFVTCTADAWTKVATSVYKGNINKVSNSPNVYLKTYRLTGGDAPTLITEGIGAFAESYREEIKHDQLIDIYIWAVANDGIVEVEV